VRQLKVKFFFTAAVTLLLIALASGCVTESNYKVLSFFFDGVPDPSIPAEIRLSAREARMASLSQARGSIHGPYGARMCDGCHNRSTNALIKPVEELCMICHDIKLDKKWIHGPLVSGGCRVCHFPHSSPNEFLLVSDSKDFCFHCHSRDDFAKNPAHEGVGSQCILCHDPHMSDNKNLLR
jgi:predicted CXXCH cytochrome family protein